MKLSSLSSTVAFLLLVCLAAMTTPAKATTSIVGDLTQASDLKWTTVITSDDKLHLYMGGSANLAAGQILFPGAVSGTTAIAGKMEVSTGKYVWLKTYQVSDYASPMISAITLKTD